MKFRFKYLFVALVFILGLSSVSAREIKAEDIDRNTYVIGTHMFTRETNDNYNGQLTIKLIMLAAKTIESDNIDDMVIYYKNAKGKWIDGVSGEELTVPETFEISHINIEKELYTPEISNPLGAGAEGTISFGIKVENITNDIETIELYRVENDEYILEKSITKVEYDKFGGYLWVTITEEEYNQGKNYAVRLKVGNSYSYYSNVLKFKDAAIKVKPKIIEQGANIVCNNEGYCTYDIGCTINNIPEDIETIELYKVEKDYVLEDVITNEEYKKNGAIFIQLTDEDYIEGKEYVVRFTKGENYSYYSNILVFKNAEINEQPEITYAYSGLTQDGKEVYYIKLNEIPEGIEEIVLYSDDNEVKTILPVEMYNLNDQGSGGIPVDINPNDYLNNRVYQIRFKSGNKYSWYSNVITIGEYPYESPIIEKELVKERNDGSSEYKIKINEIPEGIETISLYKFSQNLGIPIVNITPEEYNGGIDLVLSKEEKLEDASYSIEMRIGKFFGHSNSISFNKTMSFVPKIKYSHYGTAISTGNHVFDVVAEQVPKNFDSIELYSIEGNEITLKDIISRKNYEAYKTGVRTGAIQVSMTDTEYQDGKKYRIKFIYGELESFFSNIIEIKKED